MKILKTVMVFCAISLILNVVTMVNVAQVDARTPSQGALYGTVRLHGANISPSDIKIRIRPLVAQSDLTSASGGQPSIRIARVSAIPGELNALKFVIPDVMFGLPYRLGIQFNNKTVGKVVWRVTNEGMVSLPPPDSPDIMPVRVDGYVVTSEMEILRSNARGNADLWVGADNLDFNDPTAAVRTFRWRTSLPEVSKGRLQISTQPLRVPITGRPPNPCDTTGLIYAADFDVQRNGWTSIPPIDFRSIIMGTRAGEVVIPGVDPRTLLKLQMGAGLYVRALPLDSDGAPICNSEQSGLPGMVVVANLALKNVKAEENVGLPIKLSYAYYMPPNVEKYHPKYDEICYRVTKFHYVDPKTVDPQVNLFGQWVWNPIFDVYNYGIYYSGKLGPSSIAIPGTFFCIAQNNGDDSWLESFAEGFSNLVTGFVDTLASAVNVVAKLWEDLKGAVVGVAAGALTDLGIPCDPTCEGALETGLEIGMAAMGLPPSLPNTDQLMKMGADYLAEMAAEQVGIPGVDIVATQVAENGTDFIKKVSQDMMAKQSTPGLPDWLTYDIGLLPGILTLHLEGSGVALPTNPALYRNTDPIFIGSFVPLPKIIGTASNPLTVPMVLQPNLEGLPSLCGIFKAICPKVYGDYFIAIWNKQHWVDERLNNGCAQFDVTALALGAKYKLLSASIVPESPAYFPDNYSNCVQAKLGQ